MRSATLLHILWQVYLQSDGATALVLISATYDDDTGVLALQGTSADVLAGTIDFAMAHPDGSVSEGEEFSRSYAVYVRQLNDTNHDADTVPVVQHDKARAVLRSRTTFHNRYCTRSIL